MWGIPGTKNITKHGVGFAITKKINGKKTNLGHATTLIIALMKRDWCKANNWQKYPRHIKYIVKTPQNHYRIQKSYRHNGTFKTDYYGTFKTYEEAEKEVRLLLKYDWNIEELCECEESV